LNTISGLLTCNLLHSMKKYLINAFACIGISLLMMVALFACTEPGKKEKQGKEDITIIAPGIIRKPPSGFKDSLFVTAGAAVFYSPDSLQLTEIKKINKKIIFESLMHESFFQMRNAKLVLGKYWPQIKIIETSTCRWLVFIKNDNRKTIIDLNTKNDISGIFLFEPAKDPELIDMMNIDTALGFYFNK
jgi:hypothetical protein